MFLADDSENTSVYFTMSLCDIVVAFWIGTGRIIGLIFIDVDHSGRFYCVRIFPIYSALLGALTTYCFPLAYFELSRRISIIESLTIPLAINMSALRDYIDFIFMSFAFTFQSLNRRKLRDFLNEVREFANSYKVELKGFESSDTNYKKILSIGIALKLVRNFLHFLTIVTVVNVRPTDLFYLIIVSVPKLASLVVEIEVLIGILVIKFKIKKFNGLIKAAKKKMDFQSAEKLTMLKIDFELCDHFETMSSIHSKMYKIYKELSGLYQFQFLIILISVFFALMIDMFYVFNVSFFEYLGLSSVRSRLLRCFAFTLILFRCMDIYYMVRISNHAINSDALNQRMLSCLSTKGRDGD